MPMVPLLLLLGACGSGRAEQGRLPDRTGATAVSLSRDLVRAPVLSPVGERLGPELALRGKPGLIMRRRNYHKAKLPQWNQLVN